MPRTPIHPGEVLSDELTALNLPARKLAGLIEVSASRLYQVIAGKRNITADTALRLGRYFGTSAQFWMNLQTAYEIDVTTQQLGTLLQRIPTRTAPLPAA